MNTEALATPARPTVLRHARHTTVIAALLAGAGLVGIYGVGRVVDGDDAQPSARTAAATGVSPSDTGLALILGADYPVVANERTVESTGSGSVPSTDDAITSSGGIDSGLGVVFGPTAIAAGTPGP